MLSNDSVSCTNELERTQTNTSQASTSQTNYGPNYNTTRATTTMQALIGSYMIIELGTSLARGGSSTGIWMVINIMQMILILPLMAKFMSDKVKNFILSNAFSSFSLNFFHVKFENMSYVRDLEFDQSNEYLKDLGMQSGSTFINYITLFLFFITLILLHLLISLVHL